jgi:hypothetical protein
VCECDIGTTMGYTHTLPFNEGQAAWLTNMFASIGRLFEDARHEHFVGRASPGATHPKIQYDTS